MRPSWRRILLISGCGVSMLACNGSDDAKDGGSSRGDACQMVVTGSMSGTYDCSESPYVLQIGSSAVFMAIGLGEVGNPNAGGFGLSAAVGSPPEIETYEYTSDASAPAWAVTFSHVLDQGTEAWTGGGGPVNTPTGGKCSITFTSVGSAKTQEGGGSSTYDVHGKLRATLPAQADTGAQGEVDVVLTF